MNNTSWCSLFLENLQDLNTHTNLHETFNEMDWYSIIKEETDKTDFIEDWIHSTLPEALETIETEHYFQYLNLLL